MKIPESMKEENSKRVPLSLSDKLFLNTNDA
jgi:hypothetical protein